jgi:hypothetical protein
MFPNVKSTSQFLYIWTGIRNPAEGPFFIITFLNNIKYLYKTISGMIAAKPRLSFNLVALKSTTMAIFVGGHFRRGYERGFKL